MIQGQLKSLLCGCVCLWNTLFSCHWMINWLTGDQRLSFIRCRQLLSDHNWEWEPNISVISCHNAFNFTAKQGAEHLEHLEQRYKLLVLVIINRIMIMIPAMAPKGALKGARYQSRSWWVPFSVWKQLIMSSVALEGAFQSLKNNSRRVFLDWARRNNKWTIPEITNWRQQFKRQRHFPGREAPANDAVSMGIVGSIVFWSRAATNNYFHHRLSCSLDWLFGW